MLTNQTAVITGGSRGIGRAIALKMAESGANVAIVYAGNEEAANETCALAAEHGVTAKRTAATCPTLMRQGDGAEGSGTLYNPAESTD